MSDNNAQKDRDNKILRFSIKGAGVLNVSSSDILKSKNAQNQIKALGELKKKHILDKTS
ncbi:MAG: hypothetical protein KZQ80_17035 [Candidatus Thiodiazotropha sp. (ex Monitilora ramsayi)]|nr:hypothetical protein [Candidatus Thiodiazotropha sp. (ex Monitilora ramsayi)]